MTACFHCVLYCNYLVFLTICAIISARQGSVLSEASEASGGDSNYERVDMFKRGEPSSGALCFCLLYHKLTSLLAYAGLQY